MSLIKVGKNKLKRYAELPNLPNVLRPSFDEIKQNFFLKGCWNYKHFKNNHPIVVELGCGGGEYTIGLAQRFPDKNFIGVDIKGDRIWKGAKSALQQNLQNVVFLRTKIDFIEYAFSENEVDEIWITFPDPQAKNNRANKRITSPEFIHRYKKFLKISGLIHLKTDHIGFFDYTLKVIAEAGHSLLTNTSDLYLDLQNINHALKAEEDLLSINTFYEQKFRNKGAKICYLRFKITQ